MGDVGVLGDIDCFPSLTLHSCFGGEPDFGGENESFFLGVSVSEQIKELVEVS